ncbi:hypothetical protein FRB90_011441 [Tulasnella sp. 427]|nr:hypothetical protein FRB90_011441 [Tulasnella sp. 427]
MNSVPLPVSSESPIANLDTDVLVDVFSYLHPLDLLTVRQTCQSLNRLTYTRSLWINAVKAINPLSPALPAANPLTSLSTSELEALALRPYRFSKNILQKEPQVKAVKVISCPPEENVYSRLHKLLPGGRWLLRADNKGSLKLFDLHGDASQLDCVSELMIDGEITDVQAQVNPNGTTAAILVCSLSRLDVPPHPERMTVVTLDLSRPIPAFNEIASPPHVDDFGRVQCGTLRGDLVATTSTSGSVLIWNWVEESWIEIVDAGRRARHADLRVKFTGDDSVTTFDMMGGHAKTYPIPPLLPREKEERPQQVMIQPQGKPIGKSTGIFSCMIQSPEDTDVAILASARQVAFIGPNTTTNEPGETTFDIALQIPWTRSYLSSAHKAVASRTIDGSLVVMANSSSQHGEPLEIHVLRASNGKGSSIFNVPLPWIVPPTGPTAWKVAACPIAGTVCMINPAGDVHVFDFAL